MQQEGDEMELRVLGPIEVYDDHKLAIGGPRQRRILAALAIHAGDVVSVDRLVDITWSGEEPPERAAHNVRSYVNRIRDGLGVVADRLVTSAPGYVLELQAGEFDAFEFTTLSAAADRAFERGDLAEALARVERAVDLWRGRPYAEFADEEWAHAEVQRLDEVRAHLKERQCETLIELGRADDALPELKLLIADHPYRERPRRLQMLALYQGGRGPEAVRAFQDFRELLADEVGLDPTTELVELDRQILAHAPSLLVDKSRRHQMRGYEFHEVIGEGAFAMVWRSTQPILGREVAIKQIREHLANDPGFIRRFEVEARIVSSLEHPYIVPLYDYWREPGAAYLVMRMIPGGTLESRLNDGPLSETELRRLVDQIGSALRLAHQRGVIHRDIKPGNILIDGEGNYLLTDFGIAFGADTGDDNAAAALSTGSPSYASPEQLRREHLDERTDIFAFGVILFESASGHAPFEDERSRVGLVERQLEGSLPAPSSIDPGVPSWVDEVVGRATAGKKDDRYRTVDELIDAVRQTTGDADRIGLPKAFTGDVRNPFKGLSAFTEADAEDFCGRHRLLAHLLSVFERPGSEGRLVAAVGPSGSGKSSVVRAGLIPALRQGAIDGSSDWFLTTMMPGAHPFDELEGALVRVAASPPGPLSELMAGSDRGIARAVKQIIPDESADLLLVIDQFEELFTLVEDENERRQFIDGLIAAIREPRSRLRLVVTIRADFWDRPLRYPNLAVLLETAAVTVPPLSADELEQSIVEPIAKQRMVYEPGLVARISAEVADQPGALPLLQYALTQLFDRHDHGVLTVAEFDGLGGVSGAVARRSEETFQSLSPVQQLAAQRMFGRLVTLGDGAEDTRRRVSTTELGQDSTMSQVVEVYGNARLLAFDRDPVTSSPTVEVAHEALIREWPRLRGWLDDGRQDLRVHRHLTTSATEWNAHARDDSELYRGVRLAAAASWADGTTDAMNQLEHEFFDASVARRDAQEGFERRRTRRLRRLLITTAVVAVVAMLAGGLAFQAQRRAESSEAAADLDRLLADARSADPTDPTIGILQALAAHQINPSEETRSALHWALTARPEHLGTLGSDVVGHSMTVLGDGHSVVVHTTSTLDVWDVESRTLTRSIPVPGGPYPSEFALASHATADGSRGVVTTPTQSFVIDLDSSETLASVDHATEARVVMIDPSAQVVAIGFVDGSVEVRSVDDLSLLAEFRETVNVAQFDWSPDGKLLVVGGGDGGLVAWNRSTASIAWTREGVGFANLLTQASVLFELDGESVITSRAVISEGLGRIIETLDARTGEPVSGREVIETPQWWLTMRWLGGGSNDLVGTTPFGQLGIIDLDRGSADLLPRVAATGIALAVLPELDVLLAAGRAGIEIRSLDGSGPLQRTIPITPEKGDLIELNEQLIAFDANSEQVVTSVLGHAVPEVADLADHDLQPVTYNAPLDGPLTLFADGFGEYVVVTSIDGPSPGLTVHRGINGPPLGPPITPPPSWNGSILGITSVAGSPAGDRLVVSYGTVAVLYDVFTGEVIRALEAPPNLWDGYLPIFAQFSPDGEVLAQRNFYGISLHDASSGDLLVSSDEHRLVTPGPADEWVLTSDARGVMQVRDPKSLEATGPPMAGHAGQATWVEIAPGGEHLASWGRDETVRVWSLDTRSQFGRPMVHHINGQRAQWSPDGDLLAIPTADGYQMWNFDTDTWPDIACEVAGRNFTRSEWEQFGPRTVDYRPICNQFPLPTD